MPKYPQTTPYCPALVVPQNQRTSCIENLCCQTESSKKKKKTTVTKSSKGCSAGLLAPMGSGSFGFAALLGLNHSTIPSEVSSAGGTKQALLKVSE